MRISRLKMGIMAAMAASLLAAACGGGDEAVPTVAPAATTAPAATRAPAATTAPPAAATATTAPAPTRAPVPTATAAPVPTGTMVVALGTLGNFDLLPFTSTSRPYLDSVYDYIIGVDNNGRADKSGMVQTWQVSADGKTWTFKTATGVLFHNGDTATADDVLGTLELARSAGSKYANAGRIRSNIASLTSSDNNTVTVALNAPGIYWPDIELGRGGSGGAPAMMLPRSYLQTIGVDEANKKPIGTGPYKVATVGVGDRIVMEAVSNHWKLGVPRVKTLTYRVIPEESTRIALLKSGDADLTSTSRAAIPDIQRTQGLSIFRRDQSSSGLLRFEQQFIQSYEGYGENPFAKPDVRKALGWYAIDRKAILDTFMKGAGLLSMNFPVFFTDPAYEKMEIPAFDPTKAKQMLTQAGYANGFTIDLLTYASSPALPESLEIMEAVAVYWEKVGIKVNRKPTTFTNWIALMSAGKPLDRPTASGLIYQGIFAAPSAANFSNGHAASSAFSANRDADLDKGALAWANAATAADYVTAGRAYQRLAYDRGCAAGGGCPLFEAGDVFAAGAKVPKTWNLGAGSYSWQIELAAALR